MSCFRMCNIQNRAKYIFLMLSNQRRQIVMCSRWKQDTKFVHLLQKKGLNTFCLTATLFFWSLKHEKFIPQKIGIKSIFG